MKTIYTNKQQLDTAYLFGKETKIMDDVYKIDYVAKFNKLENGKIVITWCQDVNLALYIHIPLSIDSNRYKRKLYLEKVLKSMNQFGKLNVYNMEVFSMVTHEVI